MSSSSTIWLFLDSSKPGGIETHVLELSRALRAQGREVIVVFLKDHGPHPLRGLLETNGIPWRRLKGPLDFLRAVILERPALVHTHGYKAGILGRLICRAAGVPCCSTFHAGERGNWKLQAYGALDRMTARLVPAIAVSGTIQDRVPGSWVIENFVQIPAPVAPGKAVGFVGRFSPEKGADRLPVLARRLPGQSFMAFGDGPLLDEIKAEAPDNLRCRGSVVSMDPLWAEIGLLILPSRAEGLPMVALEAMARGIPVAAFDVGDLPRLITPETGWVVPEGDLAGLVTAICAWAVMRSELGNSRSTACRDRIAQNYSAEAVLPKVLAVYRHAGFDTQAVQAQAAFS